MKKDLVSIADLEAREIGHLVEQALAWKRAGPGPLLAGKTLALLFEKPSLRTRVSFEVAMHQLGGYALSLTQAEVGLGQREAVADVARVLSRYVQGIMVRTFAQDTVVTLAREASVPVINGLSDQEHPCQVLSDLATIYERTGRLQGVALAYVGDANNVAHSLLLAGALMGMDLRLASPPGYGPRPDLLEVAQGLAARSGARLLLTEDLREAVADAQAVYTDVWVSMGQEKEAEVRRRTFRRYQVTPELLARAAPKALFMHPLPAHHGEEIAAGLLDHPQSVVFDQAENRLHTQKAILAYLMGG